MHAFFAPATIDDEDGEEPTNKFLAEPNQYIEESSQAGYCCSTLENTGY